MKRRHASRSTTRRATQAPRGAGGRGAHKKPTPGWKSRPMNWIGGWRNPRTPAVPASLDINHAEYFAAATLMGLVGAQDDEPDKGWCRDWSFEMGEMMAAEAKRRRKRRS
jgi:hypothetical protein